MKPRIFIGSSTESLSIAYAIQENLEHDADSTVWTQDAFQLSSNTIDDLLKVVESTDFAIFVFSPDDTINIRNSTAHITRDNVIFEFGLFIGRLGKERVFYLIPRDEENLHLPTDLIGITPGKYFAKRGDGNLKAALGPFCNQVQLIIKEFNYQNVNGLASESLEAKRIAVNKPRFWEYLLFAELMEQKIEPILNKFDEFFQDLIFVPTKTVSEPECLTLLANAFKDYGNFLTLFLKIIQDEFKKSVGEQGVPGVPLEIKNVADKLTTLANEFFLWEYSLKGLNAPTGLDEIKSEMLGWSKTIMTPLRNLPERLRKLVDAHINGGEKEYAIPGFDIPEESMTRVKTLFNNYKPTGF